MNHAVAEPQNEEYPMIFIQKLILMQVNSLKPSSEVFTLRSPSEGDRNKKTSEGGRIQFAGLLILY